jgi:hypothetical protein
MKNLFFALAATTVLAGCEPATKVTKSWRDPAVVIEQGTYKKVLVVALLKDESSRRIVEDALVQKLEGRGVASYTQSFASNKDGEAVEAQLKKEGFDGAIVLRLVDIEKETNYVPGTTTYPAYYGRFGGYYGGAYGGYGTEGYYQEDKVYTVEINAYSLTLDKLIWSGTTATTNPGKIGKVIGDIANAVTDQMVKDGFLKPAGKK